MTPTRGWIQDTLLRIQNAFLDAPTLTLTPAQAASHFGLERAAGEAFLTALADAGVLIKGPDGAYARLIPRSGLAVAGGSALESRHRSCAAYPSHRRVPPHGIETWAARSCDGAGIARNVRARPGRGLASGCAAGPR